jgi:hypothetical protein
MFRSGAQRIILVGFSTTGFGQLLLIEAGTF